MDTWVCPNDRQLALRAKLGTGWSVHTPKCTTPLRNNLPLTEDETSKILLVIKRAEKIEQMELLRVGCLVDRLEKLKAHSLGDGRLRCCLCGDQFRMLGASPNLCHDCSKNVCSKCGLETHNSKNKAIYLCKMCSEKRELWRKSGAWFFKGLPRYIKPPSSQKRCRDDNNNTFNKRNLNDVKNYSTFKKTHDNDSIASSIVRDKNTFKNCDNFPSYKSNERKYSYFQNTSITDNYMNKGDDNFYYDHYKYRPSFLINNNGGGSARMNDDGLDECTNVNLQLSDNEMDMVNRLQHNRKNILKNKKNSNKSGANAVDEGSEDPKPTCESPPKNLLAWSNSKDCNNDSNNNNKNNNKKTQSIINNSNNNEESDLHSNFKLPQFTQYIRASKRLSSDEDEDKNGGYDNDDLLNIVCKKVRPKDSESDNSSYDIHQSTNHSIHRSSDFSTNFSITQSSDQSTSSASINQLTNHLSTSQPHSDVQLVKNKPFSLIPDPLISRAKNKSAELLPLQIPDHFSIEEDGSSIPETPASLGVLEFSLEFISKENILRCLIHRAKNLPAMDKRGLCDSYVRLHLLPGNIKATKRRTKTQSGDRSPVWNEVVDYLGFFSEDLKKKEIRLSILDEDTISDKFIGETIVNLKAVGEDVCKEYSVYLSGLQVIGDGAEKGSDDGEAGRILIGVVYEEQSGKLVVTIHRCVNLLAMDSNGFSDPYVKMYLKPPKDRKTKRKTRVKLKTLNPEFNEEFTYKVKQAELPSKTLDISVWDKDIGKNDFIGKVTFCKDSQGAELQHWMDVNKTPDHVHTHWHVLKQ